MIFGDQSIGLEIKSIISKVVEYDTTVPLGAQREEQPGVETNGHVKDVLRLRRKWVKTLIFITKYHSGYLGWNVTKKPMTYLILFPIATDVIR
jgi:hypothetical protein